MLSGLLFRKSRRNSDEERQPLLPQYDDDTALQARLHEKLHTYQMLRAISRGYMPSNEQVIVHLRALLAADVLNPETPELSQDGRALARAVRLWLQQFIQILQHKNSEDQIQDFIWYLSKAKLNVDLSDVEASATAAKAKADTQATYRSLQTIGSLLLNNAEFRIFMSDVGTIGKEVFRDTAFTLSDVSTEVGRRVGPSQQEEEALESQETDATAAPSKEDLQGEVNDISQAISEGMTEVANEVGQSVFQHVGEDEQTALVSRLKKAVGRLRQRPDYSDSASTLSLLLRRYLLTYAHATADTIQAVEEDVDTNPEADRALHNFWTLLRSFGNRGAWDGVEKSFKKVIEDGRTDPKFDELLSELAHMVQDMLMDPEFFENVEKRVEEVRQKSRELVNRSSIASDVDSFLSNLQVALQSIPQDDDVGKLLKTSRRILNILSPPNQTTNNQLVTDAINIFLPLAIQAIQYVPIPRLEVSTPGVDLLLENLILEPGRTVNSSSFLPFRSRLSTRNDVEVGKGRFQTRSSVKSTATITVAGLSIAAEDLGYWVNLRSGLLRLSDDGIAGFHLDERGIDLAIDIEFGRERLEKLVSLRNVRVRIHHLDYTLRNSKFSCIAWLLKPLIRPILRAALERKIAMSVAEAMHALNRELVYARERLRATRIAGPDDLWTFARAVAARLQLPEDPDVEARLGVRPGSGVFRGRYAPGSLVRLWESEARGVDHRLGEYERDGWRNEIFNVRTRQV